MIGTCYNSFQQNFSCSASIFNRFQRFTNSDICKENNYYVFHGPVTLFFVNNSLMECRITMEFLHNFFLYHEVIFSSHTMFFNAPTNEFTPTHLVTFSISRSRIRMKFYFVYRLIRLWTKCL